MSVGFIGRLFSLVDTVIFPTGCLGLNAETHEVALLSTSLLYLLCPYGYNLDHLNLLRSPLIKNCPIIHLRCLHLISQTGRFGFLTSFIGFDQINSFPLNSTYLHIVKVGGSA